MNDPVTPFSYYAMARSNLRGAKLIVGATGSATQSNVDTSVQFLLGWSAEGYLKAFLCRQEFDDRSLRKISHDLECALKYAMQNGLSFPWMGRLQLAVMHLNPGHKEMYFRYLPKNKDGTHKKVITHPL